MRIRYRIRKCMPAVILTVAVSSVVGCSDPSLTRIAFDWSEWDSPSAESRPWVRWWWPGNDVNDDEIARETAVLAAAGIGGAELQAMNAALDRNASETEMTRRLGWGSESFWGHVRHAALSAAQNGLQMDLTAGSGWPVGGPGVSAAESMKTLLWSEFEVKGPKQVDLEFTVPGPDPFYEVAVLAESIGEPLARYLPDLCVPVEVVAAKKTGGIRDGDVWNLKDQVNLNPDSTVVLTGSMGNDGKLSWSAPAGTWMVIGFFSCPDGQFVNLNAYPEPMEAFAVDQFDPVLVRRTMDSLTGVDNGLSDLFGAGIRGVFVDSFELKTNRHFAEGLLDRFQELRGYDVRPWLPVVVPPGADNNILDGAGVATRSPFSYSEFDSRIAYDYQLTVSDLFIESYVGTSTDWAAGRGLKFRVQPYGLKVDVLKAAGSADIPETEQLFAGGSDLSLKAVSSGAHQYGKNIVTAESLVCSGRDYMTTPTKAKAWLDKLFTAGVNSVIYHGFPYRTGDPKYGITDWDAFSSPYSGMGTYSENVSEASPFWKYMDTLNRYVSRIQMTLRQGRPMADVLVYYPFLGVPSTVMSLREHQEDFFTGAFEDEVAVTQNTLVELVQGVFGGFNPEESTWWLGAVWPVLRSLESQGYTWEWTNDDVLSRATVVDGRIVIEGASYKSVIVVRAPWMQPAAAENLRGMARSGIPVVVVGDAPAVQPGFNDHESGDAAVRSAFDAISVCAYAAGVPIVETPSTIENGNPRLFTAEGLVPALERLAVVPECGFGEESDVRMIHRNLGGDARVTFLRNPGRNETAVALKTSVPCADGLIADPMTGGVQPVSSLDGGTIEIILPSYGSRLLFCGVLPPEAELERPGIIPPSSAAVDSLAVSEWSLRVEGDDVSGGVFEKSTDALGDWRQVENLKYSSTPGTYRSVVAGSDLPTVYDLPNRMYLNLGEVHGAAEVRVNGSEPVEVIAEPFLADITDLVVSGENVIEITLVPALRNRLVGLGVAGDAGAVQFKDKEETVLATGIYGPVSIESRAVAAD